MERQILYSAGLESIVKTLKREEICARRYDTLKHLRANIEEGYNRQWLHSALGYQSPEEFEKQSEASRVVPDFRSASMNYCENHGNEKETSELVVGEGDSIAVPLPEPHPLLEDPGKAQ